MMMTMMMMMMMMMMMACSCCFYCLLVMMLPFSVFVCVSPDSSIEPPPAYCRMSHHASFSFGFLCFFGCVHDTMHLLRRRQTLKFESSFSMREDLPFIQFSSNKSSCCLPLFLFLPHQLHLQHTHNKNGSQSLLCTPLAHFAPHPRLALCLFCRRYLDLFAAIRGVLWLHCRLQQLFGIVRYVAETCGRSHQGLLFDMPAAVRRW
jgi:hypothetical protein